MVKLCDKKFSILKNNYYKDKFSKYSFELSDFQKYSIEGIEKGGHVLVTAHTGSGKTLPAEYSIEKFVSEGKKVIYTSPIKALSNQKFHEFKNKFPNISFGILTGDIKFNPEADCLIMTTEILRNTLFQKKCIEETERTDTNNKNPSLLFEMDIQNELGCVIFDEVHYINDADRGTVWEETIIMMPEHVQMVMLSATIDRAESFAKWIESNKSKEVWLATTNERVVPLTHYCYMATQDSVFKKIKDKTISEDYNNFCNKLQILKTQNGILNDSVCHKVKKIENYYEKNKIIVKRNYVLNEIVKHLYTKNMLPAICFVFSRKMAETYASEITSTLFEKDSKIPSIIKNECTQILMKLPNYKEYIHLPEFTFLIRLFEKGIAVHHSGIMPILREMTELLFQKGYIKLLFATETFAVGLNMPTKTVIYTSLQKYDGHGFRYLKGHEYTQMSGRAGRRGIDTKGYVVHASNLFETPDVTSYNIIMDGKPQRLDSKFIIHYNLLLNLIQSDQQDFTNFTDKSMVMEQINNELNEVIKKNEELQEKIDNRVDGMKHFKTDIDLIQKYLESKKTLSLLKPKKRKNKIREIKEMEDLNKKILEESKKVEEIEIMKTNYKEEKKREERIRDYINYNIRSIIKILEENNFITCDESKYKITDKGKISSVIQECHCLAFSDLYNFTNGFNELSVTEIISLFSCFTNIRVSDEIRIQYPNTNSEKLNNICHKLHEYYNKYYDIETSNSINTGEDYNIHFDILNAVIEWCESDSEENCKIILQKLQKEKKIFIGEFSKAILKINNISNEIEKLCEITLDIELLSKIKQISEKTLKYVITNQSLYI